MWASAVLGETMGPYHDPSANSRISAGHCWHRANHDLSHAGQPIWRIQRHSGVALLYAALILDAAPPSRWNILAQ